MNERKSKPKIKDPEKLKIDQAGLVYIDAVRDNLAHKTGSIHLYEHQNPKAAEELHEVVVLNERISKKEKIKSAVKQKIEEKINIVEHIAEDVTAIPDYLETQVTGLGGDTHAVEEKLQKTFKGSLQKISDTMKGKFAKIAALVGLITLSENINAQSISFEEKKESLSKVLKKDSSVESADSSLLFSPVVIDDRHDKNIERYVRDEYAYKAFSDKYAGFENQEDSEEVDAWGIVAGFEKYQKLLKTFGYDTDTITMEDAYQIIANEPASVEKAFNQIHIEFKNLGQAEQEKLDYYKKRLRETVFEAQNKRFQMNNGKKKINEEFVELGNRYKFYDNIRQEEIKHITDKKYLERLAYELEQSGLVGTESFYLKKRLDQLSDDYSVVPGEMVTDKAVGQYDPTLSTEDIKRYYDMSKEEYDSIYASQFKTPGMSYLPSKIVEEDKVYPEATALHEYRHESTNGQSLMTPYARKLYLEAVFDSKAEILNQEADSVDKDDSFLEYMKSATELDARKRVFEKELEKLNIKKYDEEFTEKHYKKALELEKKDKLGPDSKEFLRYVNEKLIYKIMNTIA